MAKVQKVLSRHPRHQTFSAVRTVPVTPFVWALGTSSFFRLPTRSENMLRVLACPPDRRLAAPVARERKKVLRSFEKGFRNFKRNKYIRKVQLQVKHFLRQGGLHFLTILRAGRNRSAHIQLQAFRLMDPSRYFSCSSVRLSTFKRLCSSMAVASVPLKPLRS